MTAKIIDGKAIAETIRAECKARVDALLKQNIKPGLAVMIVGDNQASKTYVRNKAKSSEAIGLHSEVHEFPENITEEALLAELRKLNNDKKIHGILVQLPLPKHIDSKKILESIAIEKDVDGFHPYNVGRLVTGNMLFAPCTPYGIQVMLERENIPLWGKSAVVLGASNIVGKPMAMMLLQKGATVSICNSKTPDISQYTKNADIVIAAVGKVNVINGSMIKPGAVVIDVGINRNEEGKLVGDVDFESTKQRAGYITPVPGGVGPMTITMLLHNTIQSAERLAKEIRPAVAV
jgi:methylenetetrahydrofolate dehydrogenase (NADP+)/methenyltetrahydrofolate cyclohydrolase